MDARRLIPAALLGLSGTLSAQAPVPRQVAAPASDILSGVVRLPDPASAPTVSRSALIPLRFRREAIEAWSAEVELPVDQAGGLALALLSPDAASWRLLARAPGALEPRPVDDLFASGRRVEPAGEEMPGWGVDRRDLRDAPAGTWTLRVEARGSRAPAEGWLVARTAGAVRVEAFVTTLELGGDAPIGIAARARNAGRVERARVLLEMRGSTSEIAMQDDGLHEDGAAGDGLLGALVPPGSPGPARARVEIEGATADGLPFLRTAQLAFQVLEPALLLDGSGRAGPVAGPGGLLLPLRIGAVPLGPPRRLHVSAEVWGSDASGRLVPVCWLSRMLEPEPRDGGWDLPLALDLRWLDVADAGAPLELRQARAQDPDTEAVLDRIERIPLDTAGLAIARGPLPRPITAEMLTGGTNLTLSSIAPAPPHAATPPALFNPALMLVHGYCSSGSIWPAADFTQPKLEFLDPSANRTHDQFAQILIQKAQAAGLSSFGVVAHSQGGCAALHLFTYYASGLDLAQGGRRIQSLASPYQGTPLASLGGFACGVNNDMTPSGSATWLAGIPSWARAEVWFWTTSDAGSACNALTSLFLSDPEDGTVEKFRGDLPGGNSMGHVTGWCHTTGMSWPASYTDHARNQAMNAAAAR